MLIPFNVFPIKLVLSSAYTTSWRMIHFPSAFSPEKTWSNWSVYRRHLGQSAVPSPKLVTGYPWNAAIIHPFCFFRTVRVSACFQPNTPKLSRMKEHFFYFNIKEHHTKASSGWVFKAEYWLQSHQDENESSSNSYRHEKIPVGISHGFLQP